MLTVRDAARLLQTTESTLQRWIRDKSIPFQRVSETYRFNRSELLEWATARGIHVASGEFLGDDDGVATPRLSDALAAGGVHHRVPGTDTASVMRAVAERLPIDPADRDLVCDVLLAREALGSTGVGDGVAIPHVRRPLVLSVGRPSITLCFLETPVDLHAVDDRPVDTIFSVVSATIRGHLYLLSRIAAGLHDAPFKSAIRRHAAADEILALARRLDQAPERLA